MRRPLRHANLPEGVPDPQYYFERSGDMSKTEEQLWDKFVLMHHADKLNRVAIRQRAESNSRYHRGAGVVTLIGQRHMHMRDAEFFRQFNALPISQTRLTEVRR